MKVREVGAKGADSFLAWGNAPGFVEGPSPALKARFTLAASAIENQWMKHAFSAFLLGYQIPGAMPQAQTDTAPLALKMDNENARHRRRPAA
jgi:hypothetical protein